MTTCSQRATCPDIVITAEMAKRADRELNADLARALMYGDHFDHFLKKMTQGPKPTPYDL